ncbi:MAG: sugar nucleotide-binding protein [Phycisphaerales bacterium]|nr:sugar nucleotide-binding protein [Phycisphaerales bacterium]
MREALRDLHVDRERWLITGASGQLGGVVAQRLAALRATAFALLGQGAFAEPAIPASRVDLADHDAVDRHVRDFAPTRILHIGAMTAVGDCHRDPRRAEAINVGATRILTACARDLDARLVFTSTDMVFDGAAAPYAESDEPTPLSTYGHTKVRAEQALAAAPNTLAVRIPLMIGFPATERPTTFVGQYEALVSGRPLRLFTDEWRTPITLDDAADALIALAQTDVEGVVHVAGPERLSRYEIVATVAEALGARNAKLEQVSRLSIEAAEPRPADLSLQGACFATMLPAFAPRAIGESVFHRRPD